MTNTSKGKGKRKKKDTEAADNSGQKKPKDDKGCFFSSKSGHVKKDCTKYHAWRAKKGTFFGMVCSEINLASVSRNTWWLDSGATIHISVSMQGCLNYRKPIDAERYIYVGNGEPVKVEAIGHFRLLLRTGSYLDLKDTFIVPSFRRNLVSISTLDKSGYFFLLEINSFIFH